MEQQADLELESKEIVSKEEIAGLNLDKGNDKIEGGNEKVQSAILGFLNLVSSLSSDSELGQCFRSRVRDKFKAVGTPATNF